MKRKLTTDVKTANPQPSTSKDELTSTQPTQAETISEQQPEDATIAEQQQESETGSTQQAQDNSTSTLPSQDKSVPEQRQQHASDTLTFYLARTVTVHFQIMVKNSNCLQQKIPVPYQRN